MATAGTVSGIRLEAHGDIFETGPGADVEAFVSAANAKVRVAGLDDALNPRALDPSKVQALLTRLPDQSHKLRLALAGHALRLGAPGLGVLAVEPTTPNGFDSSYTLVVERTVGNRLLARAKIAVDPTLARDKATRAQAATFEADRAVKAAEKGSTPGEDLQNLRWRRAQAASAWRVIADAWHSAFPKDATASKARIASHEAVAHFDMPSGGQP